MVFEISGKVAIITGGASGLGFEDAKELLRNGLKAVTLADVDQKTGKQAVKEIEAEFGPNRAIFIATDVSDYKQFENAFKKTINQFRHIDILINNAGIMNDAEWEKEIAINVNGVVHGTLLALENYMLKHKTGDEGVIINMSSIAGVEAFAMVPIYTGTKHAVLGMSRSFGSEVHYQRTKVKVLTLCPGATNTPLLTECSGKNLGKPYEDLVNDTCNALPVQEPSAVAKAIVKIIKCAKTGTVWISEGNKEAYEFMVPNRDDFAKA